MRAKLALVLASLTAGALLLGGCGAHRRPPVIAAPAPVAPPSARPAYEPEPEQPIDAGPDIRQLDNDAALGEELARLGTDPEASPLADVHFDYDSALLPDEARGTLEQHARWLIARPSAKVTIEGHCDDRGTVEYNLALGDQRARAVLEYLIGLGVPAGRLTTASYGKERPLDPGGGEAAWARNRRAHFAVSR